MVFRKDAYVVEDVNRNKFYLYSGIDRSYQAHHFSQVGEEIEHGELQKRRKHERMLKNVGVDLSNVVEGKRERRKKVIVDA